MDGDGDALQLAMFSPDADQFDLAELDALIAGCDVIEHRFAALRARLVAMEIRMLASNEPRLAVDQTYIVKFEQEELACQPAAPASA